MLCLKNLTIFVAGVFYYTVGFIANDKYFNVRDNTYLEVVDYYLHNTSSVIQCCMFCANTEACWAINHNRFSEECKLLTQNPALITGSLVSKQNWTFASNSDGCNGNWVQFRMSCYLLVDSPMSWSSARAHCQAIQADLVDIHSAEENAFVASLSTSTTDVWIGLTDTAEEGIFVWSSGRPVTYTIYYPGEPSNSGGHEDCGEIRILYNDEWNDSGCYYNISFLCEKSFA